MEIFGFKIERLDEKPDPKVKSFTQPELMAQSPSAPVGYTVLTWTLMVL
jgi:hypothetical protein